MIRSVDGFQKAKNFAINSWSQNLVKADCSISCIPHRLLFNLRLSCKNDFFNKTTSRVWGDTFFRYQFKDIFMFIFVWFFINTQSVFLPFPLCSVVLTKVNKIKNYLDILSQIHSLVLLFAFIWALTLPSLFFELFEGYAT